MSRYQNSGEDKDDEDGGIVSGISRTAGVLTRIYVAI